MVNETIETLIGKFENKNDPNIRKTAEEMDEMRQKTLAYEYLCHLAEAKVWLEACLKEKLPPTTELEENLRNGVYLAKLGNFIAPDIVPKQKIYDIDQKRFNTAGLQFRHTDNINMWLQVLKTTELPITFQPETTDVYDKKNMPRVIYCIHALSTHLFKLGRAPLIQDLFGKVQFTDEEIDKVRKELQKYGITMPAFQKIGGLLSSNIAADAASVHAAIIHLNRVIDTDEEITNALLNPEVKLNYVYPPYENTYKTVLRQAKMEKIRAAQNRSLNDSYVPDVYDELLTQVEVQGHITNINYKNTWKAFMEATKENSLTKMKKLFQMEWMKKYKYTPANLDFYCDLIGHLYDSRYEFDIGSVIDWQKIFESIINEGNKRASDHSEHKDAIKAVNAALDRGGVEDLYRALTNPHLEINANIDKSAMPLFYEEMKIDKNECEKDINESEIAASVIVLSSIAAISRAVERGDENIIWTALNSEHAHLQNLRVHCRQRYAAALFSALKVKSVHETLCPLLTYLDIQECIDEVNAQSDNNEELIATLNNINKTVQGADNKKLLALLKNPKLNLNVQIHNDEIDLYMRLMKMCRKKKGGSDLWLDDIKSIAAEVSREALDIREWTITLVEINIAMSKSDSDGLIRILMEKDFRIMNTSEDDKALYFQTFSDYFKKKNKYVCPWVVCHTTQGNTAYIDIESSTHSWVTPKDFVPHSRYLSKKDIDSILRKLDRQFNARTEQEVRENMIIKLQACARGYLVRRSLQARRNYLQTKIKAIIKIQAWWRSVAVQKKYGKIIKMKTIERLVQQMTKKDPWSWYRIQESKIILIQALWRGRRARRAFLALFHNKNPPYKVVKMFIPILDFSTQDYEKELELQTLKSQVVQAIRKNQQLSKQLDSMDVKIGLLVQNRITLQDVVAHGVRLNDLLKQNSIPKIPSQKNQLNEVLNPCTALKGLKSLTKESKRLLDGYQHLFYELQTNPVYLSKLLFCVPQNKANQFLQNVILTIYNFGANTRDEYLLMKLFRHTLEEEIKCKVSKPFDIISNNPIVLKMAVSHSRQMNGLASLRAIVGPLVEKMINDKDLNIETGPVEIYKAWRNESEMKTGQMSPLPYCVTQDEALKYPEVRDRLEKGLTKLKEIVTAFLTKISDSVELMPFCILYMARVLHRTLSLKFPNAPEKELLKVVGNLVYYQFLNAAIVAPDAFHVVNLQHDLSLTTDQRRNLASVAKILHFAAAKKGFGDESAHLKSLNTFIIDCHEKMKSFFRHCCEGPTLEQYYSVDEYTEVTMLHKPYIYISIQEIVDTHSLLVEYQDIIASNPHDKLHSLLDELGPVPTAADLASRSRESLASAEAHARLDVCLALVDKFQTPDDDTTDINKLFIKAKELCVSVMPFLSGEHLLEALCIGTTKAQQENYASWIQRRLYSGAIRADEVITLRDHISLLRKYLDRLEEEGYVNREDGYQSIVTSIALDLCNKGKYRQAQRQALQTLRRTKRSLNEKTKFYQDQCHYYDQYIKKCLENLNAGKRSVHMCLRKARKNHGKLKSKLTVKYSGAKLHEKGVLLEIDGLPNSQFKNVQFEITPSDVNGVFTVQGKFLGIEVEKIDIDIQELLQRQYEGSTVMDLFGKAKVNVNLLLFLLNSKFYGKH